MKYSASEIFGYLPGNKFSSVRGEDILGFKMYNLLGPVDRCSEQNGLCTS